MSADYIMVSPERGTSRVLFRRLSAEAPPGDWDDGWRSVTAPKFIKLNPAGWCVFDGNSAFRELTGRPRGAWHSDAG
jgi:hypothetical protein